MVIRVPIIETFTHQNIAHLTQELNNEAIEIAAGDCLWERDSVHMMAEYHESGIYKGEVESVDIVWDSKLGYRGHIKWTLTVDDEAND